MIFTPGQRGDVTTYDEYVKCLYQAECVIEEKSEKLGNAIRIFLFGLISFPVLFALGMVF